MNKFLLNEYGRPDLIGFNYVLYILENYKNPNIQITKLYDEISRVYKVTKVSVERNIRTYKENVEFESSTNKEFICTLIMEANMNN